MIRSVIMKTIRAIYLDIVPIALIVLTGAALAFAMHVTTDHGECIRSHKVTTYPYLGLANQPGYAGMAFLPVNAIVCDEYEKE